MTKKELIAHCNSLVKQVARKQLTIEDLRKKKGVPNTASLGECKQCKVHEGRYTDVIYENRMKDEKYRDESENLEDQIEGLKKDIARIFTNIVETCGEQGFRLIWAPCGYKFF